MKPMTEKHLAVLRRHMVEIVDMHFDLAGMEMAAIPSQERHHGDEPHALVAIHVRVVADQPEEIGGCELCDRDGRVE